MRLQIAAHGKINLTLHITGKQPDGYHTLNTIMQSIALADVITLTPNDINRIALLCSYDSLSGEKNLAHKAATMFMRALGREDGFDITIQKNIPLSAGLGGGSADAAAVLWGLNLWYNRPFTDEKMMEMALKLGADVPFCLKGGTCLATGVGEQLDVLPPCPDCGLVLIKPCEKGSTGEMYRKYDEIKGLPPVENCAIIEGIQEKSLEKIAGNLVNAFVPLYEGQAVERAMQDLITVGAMGAGLSGSGPTVFGIFPDEAAAGSASRSLSQSYKNCIVTHWASCGCQLI